MLSRFQWLCGAAAVVVSGGLARQGDASYHTFKFSEIYSNASGTVQFIELHESLGLDGQNLETLAPDIFSFSALPSTSNREHTIQLTNLPSFSTANTYFLLGTAAYNAIPGAPKADYLIPDSFFKPTGDSLQYGSTGIDGVVDQITFGALPTDSSQALQRSGTIGSTFTTGPAVANTFSSGGNFSVPEPSAAALVAITIFGIVAAGRRGGRSPAKA